MNKESATIDEQLLSVCGPSRIRRLLGASRGERSRELHEESAIHEVRWDDQKAVENLNKHGVSFGEATEVFYDPNALEAYDQRHSIEEARFITIGLSSRRLLYVVFAERSNDLIRIVSARKAKRSEEIRYGQFGSGSSIR